MTPTAGDFLRNNLKEVRLDDEALELMRDNINEAVGYDFVTDITTRVSQ